jgi:hypothetical protein
MGTDGIWNAENERGERFGKYRFKSLIRDHAQESAQKRVGAVMASLHHVFPDIHPRRMIRPFWLAGGLDTFSLLKVYFNEAATAFYDSVSKSFLQLKRIIR